jgi:hypothetical protein
LQADCEAEGRPVRGTRWLIEELFSAELVDMTGIRAAYLSMKAEGRRLPWNEVEAQLKRLG